jgi:eukaryotic-like serine/threonine-protein kinase
MIGLPTSLVAGRFAVECVLGRGGMATVVLAHDHDLARPVAIKLLADNLAADEEIRRRFLREARLAARLAHPNVVQVYDAGEDGRPYIVMEYVDGESMADALERRGRLTLAEAIDVGVQSCAGLEHAHAAGLVHRDVKPQNLLRRLDGTVKIVDFGIAKPAKDTALTDAGGRFGTAAYVAPERLSDAGSVTGAADIYSLGVVLYELITGRTPYPSDSLTELLRAQRDRRPPPISTEVSGAAQAGAFEDVVLRCLAADPEERPSSAAALARELAASAPEEAIPELPPESGVRATDVTLRLPRTREEPATARRPHAARSARPAAALYATLAVIVAGALMAVLLGSNDSGGRRPEARSVPRASDPADQARELATWVEERTRR